tara:strand:+ start:2174 stop:3958 length:1785 start_codon:yes stop_codon:yes gene_type:complete
MSSLNKGLSEYLSSNPLSGTADPTTLEVFTCHVLEVVKDEKSPYYDPKLGKLSIGSIKVKIVERQYNKFDDISFYRAFPFDRGDYMVPLPGEAVMCTMGMTPIADGPNRTFGMSILYIAVVSLDSQLTKNSAPFLSSDAYHTDSRLAGFFQQLQIDSDILKKRFDNRLDIAEKAFADSKGVTLMRPGDTVLEGRFGGLIKMTSTQTEGWDPVNQITNIGSTSMPADPMTIIKAHRRYNRKPLQSTLINDILGKPDYLDDDINFDDASIYMLSTQNVPLEIQCSEYLRSWNYTTHIDGLSTTLSKMASLSTLYGGGFDSNYKLTLKVIGTLEIPGGGQQQVGGGANTPLGADEAAKAKTVMDAFVKSGFTAAQAAGIVGNIVAESQGMKEWNIENGHQDQQPDPADGSWGSKAIREARQYSGIGLMQWTYGNRDRWEKYVGQYLLNTPGADTSRIKDGRLITNPATFDGGGDAVEEYLKTLNGLFDASVAFAVNDYVPGLGNFTKMMQNGVPRGNTNSIYKNGGFMNIGADGVLDVSKTATVCEMFLCDGEVPGTVGGAIVDKPSAAAIQAYQKSVIHRVELAIKVFNSYNTTPV